MNPRTFAEQTRALIGLEIGEAHTRWDGGIRLELGEISWLDDVMSWGEASIGISPRWEIQGGAEISLNSEMPTSDVHSSLYKLLRRRVEGFTLGTSEQLEVLISGGVRLSWLEENKPETKFDKRWLVDLPQGGMIYMISPTAWLPRVFPKMRVIRHDKSHRGLKELVR